MAVVCHFNPKDLSITRKIKWIERTRIGENSSEMSYAGGEAQDFDIPLLFDNTDTGIDVRKSYLPLLALMDADPTTLNLVTSKGEPPRCRFVWGRFLSFTAVISQLAQKFTFFNADGTPLRAEVKVSFSQVHTRPKPQNPTSHSEVRRVWVVQEGETLDWIAYQKYGDSSLWRHIAKSNNLLNPMILQPGQVLKLIPLS